MYKKLLLRAFIILNLTIVAELAFADFEWHGRYSFDASYLSNANLADKGLSKRYATHHLTLLPELVPADYFKIHARLDIFNNNLSTPNQAGALFGGTSTAPEGAALANNMSQEFIAVNELFLTWSKENALLAVGRVPYEFGLGIFNNSGRDLFDHWFTTKDMIMGQVSIGPFVVRPMIAKTNELAISSDDSDIDEYLLEFEFNVPDSETQIALLYSLKSGQGATSFNPNFIGGSLAAASGDFKLSQYGLFVNKRWGQLGLGLEVNILDGDTGYSIAGNKVAIDSFGAAMELNWKSKDSPWAFSFKTGYASGDDLSTPNKYEGFAFHPNYDIALILFNHPVGPAGVDVLGTGSYRGTTVKADALDEERISNAIYFAPSVGYKFSKKYEVAGSFVAGMLVEKNLQSSSSLGSEIDLSFTFKPFSRMSWVTEAGYLLTGEALESAGVNKKDTYIIKTKAAISF